MFADWAAGGRERWGARKIWIDGLRLPLLLAAARRSALVLSVPRPSHPGTKFDKSNMKDITSFYNFKSELAIDLTHKLTSLPLTLLTTFSVGAG